MKTTNRANLFLLALTMLGMLGFVIGCQSAPAEQLSETVAVLPATQVILSPTATEISPTATLPPPPLVPTVPPPATATPLPTVVLPTATPLPPPTAMMEIEPSPEPETTIAIGCRSSAELSAVRPRFIVTGANWPRPGASPVEVFSGYAADSQLIHLGFDVEGSPNQLEALLDVLDRRQVKTTMFILGSWAEAYPDWIREIAKHGHEFANHTYSHGNMREMDAETVVNELQRTETIVQNLTGTTTQPWLRPPFGSRSDISVEAAAASGWTTVLWSGSSEDWRSDTTADMMCATLLSGSYPGSILYSHSYHPDIPDVVDRFIGEMQSRGYTFVPLSVILSSNPGQYLAAP